MPSGTCKPFRFTSYVAAGRVGSAFAIMMLALPIRSVGFLPHEAALTALQAGVRLQPDTTRFAFVADATARSALSSRLRHQPPSAVLPPVNQTEPAAVALRPDFEQLFRLDAAVVAAPAAQPAPSSAPAPGAHHLPRVVPVIAGPPAEPDFSRTLPPLRLASAPPLIDILPSVDDEPTVSPLALLHAHLTSVPQPRLALTAPDIPSPPAMAAQPGHVAQPGHSLETGALGAAERVFVEVSAAVDPTPNLDPTPPLPLPAPAEIRRRKLADASGRPEDTSTVEEPEAPVRPRRARPAASRPTSQGTSPETSLSWARRYLDQTAN